MPPRSEQDEEPSSGWANPVGHAKHERLGLVFCCWKKPAGHSEHVLPVAGLNFPLSLFGEVVGMEVHDRKSGREKDRSVNFINKKKRKERRKKLCHDVPCLTFRCSL